MTNVAALFASASIAGLNVSEFVPVSFAFNR